MFPTFTRCIEDWLHILPTMTSLSVNTMTIDLDRGPNENGNMMEERRLLSDAMRQLVALIINIEPSLAPERLELYWCEIRNPFEVDDAFVTQIARLIRELPTNTVEISLQLPLNPALDHQRRQLLMALSNSHLTDMYLNGMDLSGNDDESWQQFFKSIVSEFSRNMRSLWLHDCNLGNSGFATVLQATLHPSSTVTELHVSRNNISAVPVELINWCQDTNKQLEFDLDYNPIGDAGVAVLATALLTTNRFNQNHLSLNELHTVECGIGDAGCFYLKAILEKHAALVKLDLTCNHITDEGLRLLTQGLRNNRTLEILSIDRNAYTEQGLQALVEHIQSGNHALYVVHIDDDQFPDQHDIIRWTRDFRDFSREVRQGIIRDDRGLVPYMGATRVSVKSTVVFLLLRTRSETFSQAWKRTQT